MDAWGGITATAASFGTTREALDYTVKEMLRLARLREMHPQIRSIGIAAARRCPTRNQQCQAAAILAWMRRSLVWVPDPPRELVSDPLVTLQLGGGDCDDLSPVYVAIAKSIGIPSGLATGARDPWATEPSHVLPVVFLGGQAKPAEVSSNALPFGSWPLGFRIERLYKA